MGFNNSYAFRYGRVILTRSRKLTSHNIVQALEQRLLFVSFNQRVDDFASRFVALDVKKKTRKRKEKQLRKIQNLVSLNNSIYIKKQNSCNAMNVDSEPLSPKKAKKKEKEIRSR